MKTALVSLVICSLFVLTCALSRRKYIQEKISPSLKKCLSRGITEPKVYDFIIVGAGSAGSVLANRLSESFSVLVIEAGGEELNNPIIDIPLFARGGARTPLDWNFTTVAQTHGCKGMKNKKCFLQGGHVLGGSSCINDLVYTRGSPEDFDRWVAEGAKGWSFKNVEPFFLKAENNLNATLAATVHHATGGPLSVSDSRVTLLPDTYLESAREAGHTIDDINGATTRGFAAGQQTAAHGVRQHTARAYLRPAMTRFYLDVMVNSQVTKVLFHKYTAIGVEFKLHGKKHRACIHKEVILSAGTYNSPKILMLSGIGPKRELHKHKIPMKVNLPVGKNLRDRPVALAPFTITQPLSVTPSKIADPLIFLEYRNFGTGIYSSNLIEAIGYMGTENVFKQRQLEIAFISSFPVNDPNAFNGVNINKQILADLGPLLGGNQEGFGVTIILSQPKSRGWVRLASSDPADLPRINPRYLHDPADLDTLVDGMIDVIDMVESSVAMQAIGAQYRQLDLTACRKFKIGSKKLLKCFIQQLMFPANHGIGTCRMGNKKSKLSVVDPRFRVIGVKGLRVVDASAMPSLVSANMNANVIMLAERAADLIKKDHQH